MTETTWMLGYTRAGRRAHAVDLTTRTTKCGHPALKWGFGLWVDRDPDIIWCEKCTTALSDPSGTKTV